MKRPEPPVLRDFETEQTDTEITQYYMGPNDGMPMTIAEAERQGITFGLPFTDTNDRSVCKRHVIDSEYVALCHRPYFHWTVHRRDSQPVAPALANCSFTTHQQVQVAINTHNARTSTTKGTK